MLDSGIIIVETAYENNMKVHMKCLARCYAWTPKAAGAREPPFVSLFPFFFSPSLSLFAGANSIFERPYLWMRKPGPPEGRFQLFCPPVILNPARCGTSVKTKYHAVSIHHTLHLVLRAVVPACYCYSQLDGHGVLW